MEGVLIKWTNYIEFWKERRFTIRGPILSYYVPENKSNKPKRRVFLGLADIIEPELEKDEKGNEKDEDFGFEIDTGAEHYYIKAQNKEEKQKWLNGLKNGKILGEKMIRESMKNIKKDNNNNKFEQFKKIYNEKIKKVYKNNKQFHIVLKQFDNIIDFIEGKGKLELFKIINNNKLINNKNKINNNNKDIIINNSISNIINYNQNKIKNNNYKNATNNDKYQKIIKNENNTKNKNLINSNKIKYEKLDNGQKLRGKKLIENKSDGKLAVSVNNFTERGYLLKGEEFFDMDEILISNENQKDINEFKTNNIQKKEINLSQNINNIKNNYNKKNIKINKKQDKLKGQFYDSLYSYERRTSLPEQSKEVSFNIFKIIKDAIGKDLNHFAMPVFLNEPLSMLQKLCENFQYADLLNRAAEEPNPHLRLAYVACFNIAGLTMNIHRAKKLFNPILFETYEYIDNNLNYRFFAEQVSHHPAISAFFAEGKGWNIYSNNNSKVNISISGTIEIKYLEKSYINFTNFNDEINFTKPISKMRNIYSDPVLDLYDKFWVKNNEGDECIINLIPFNEANKVGNLNGEIKDIEGNIIFKIEGNWCEKIKIINKKNNEEKVLWEIIKSCDKNNHYFQPYTFDLNNLTEEMKQKLPRTDSRFRGDQRLMEYQKFDEAETEKVRLEEKQRKKRKENEKEGIHPLPRYFEETYDDITGELIYKYKGNYFEDRKNNNFKDLPDLFGPS